MPVTKRSTRQRRAGLFSLGASLLIHASLLVLAAFILLNRPAGLSGAGDEIQLAIVTQSQLTDIKQAAADVSLPQLDATAPAELLDQTVFETPIADATTTAAAGRAPGLEGAGQSLGEGLDLGGGGGSASFFGVEARGSRFAYIVDISGSMAGPKIQTLRKELISSVESLSEHASFLVVFYSSEPRIVGGRKKWARAVKRNKDLAEHEVNAVSTGGATNPLPAFEIVFKMRPRPDAIYFMTDGQFSETVASEVARMNSSWIEPTPIHTISFVSRDAEAQLKRIARESGGTYTHIERAH